MENNNHTLYGIQSSKDFTIDDLPILIRLRSELFTAKDNSMGSSGGTTLVKISVHSRNSLYLFLSGSFVPEQVSL